ncbi:hypothetical protein ACQWF5_26200, partial [Salmonella enterica subsp. enterica serovar Infantis]
GDCNIFVAELMRVFRFRTGEADEAALYDPPHRNRK